MGTVRRVRLIFNKLSFLSLFLLLFFFHGTTPYHTFFDKQAYTCLSRERTDSSSPSLLYSSLSHFSSALPSIHPFTYLNPPTHPNPLLTLFSCSNCSSVLSTTA